MIECFRKQFTLHLITSFSTQLQQDPIESYKFKWKTKLLMDVPLKGSANSPTQGVTSKVKKKP